MAKNRIVAPAMQQPQVERKARIFKCPIFSKTYEKYKRDPVIMDALADFIEAKRADPMAPFKKKDKPFVGGDLKGYMHSGLSYDVSIVYTISGRNPHIITLLGIFSHDELGTGNPPRTNLQRQAAKTFANQASQAVPLSKMDESAKSNGSLLQELLSMQR